MVIVFTVIPTTSGRISANRFAGHERPARDSSVSIAVQVATMGLLSNHSQCGPAIGSRELPSAMSIKAATIKYVHKKPGNRTPRKSVADRGTV